MKRSAVISPDGRYRYRLERQWGASSDPCVFAMLNPSTADASVDDPTIRRCIGYATAWGFDRLVVINLFAVRATDPRELYRASDPVGPDNAEHWERTLQEVVATRRGLDTPCGLLVCAWGTHGSHMGQDQTALGWCEREGVVPHMLKLTQKGQPSHPLYLPSALKPARWAA